MIITSDDNDNNDNDTNNTINSNNSNDNSSLAVSERCGQIDLSYGQSTLNICDVRALTQSDS